MHPSSDQETLNALETATKSGRLTLKNQTVTATSLTTAKNGKKNGSAKDAAGGGILAAVTKTKMSSKPSAMPTLLQSPETKPTTSNGDPVTSPLLDALSSAASGPSPNTTEWARSVPSYSSSPGNLINLGESPPTLPSSYEDRLTNFGWNIREQRGIPNGHPPSASPPSHARRRPLSFQVDGNYPHITEDMFSQASSNRRSSMFSQYPRYGSHPPLPHQPQAHFYGAPDAQILSPPPPGLVPGDRGYHCGFDCLSFSQDSTKPADNVIVAGYEGGINIYSASRRGLSKITTIDGLRGGVYAAKILPWDIRGASPQLYPLIAAIVHGPVWTSERSPDYGASPSEGVSMTPSESIRGSPVPQSLGLHEGAVIDSYQTTVEIYSVDTRKHVTTLLSLPPTHLSVPTTSPLFKAPPPIGSLTLRADDGTLVVASGTSGETWIFRHEASKLSPSGTFRCIGKVWTTVQHGASAELPATNPHLDWQSVDPSTVRKQYTAPVLSLSGRWLAYCPAAPSSQVSLRATIPGAASVGRVSGLNAHAPPQLPALNCAVETPGGESMIKQLAQAATQEMIKGVSYLGKQGAQAWNNYWSKPPAGPSGAGPPYPHPPMNHQFPPTHGNTSQPIPVIRDPGLISILDLDSLARQGSSGSAPHALATFKVPLGCSFLSFAPSGLALFAASSKGDTQFVWDLMRMQYAKSSFLRVAIPGTTVHGPHVRQIAQFSRMTIARIVDVVWTSPHGERAAMVTEPGTVHILDLPASAFTWPPPRRRVVPPKPADADASTPQSAASVASNAVSSLWTAARPLVSRPRRSSAGIPAISAASITSQAGHGTQALASGISRSVGAATGRMNEMRKSGTPKLHLPRTGTAPGRSCVRIIDGKRNDTVMVLGGGIVGFYTVKSRRADRPADKQKASRGAKYFELRIPSLPDFRLTSEMMHDMSHAADLDLTERDIEDTRLKIGNSPKLIAVSRGAESSIPQAEIESNAPYQPFHTDRRVALFVYSNEEACRSPSVSALLAPPEPRAKSNTPTASFTTAKTQWVFGVPIATSKLDIGHPRSSEDDLESSSADLHLHRALPSSAIERFMRVTDSTHDMEQIVVTTRRRPGVGRAGDGRAAVDEEGFFEDDCEVLDFASQRV